jgi:hypothetical protein
MKSGRGALMKAFEGTMLIESYGGFKRWSRKHAHRVARRNIKSVIRREVENG